MSAITILDGSAGAHVHSDSVPLLVDGLDEMEDATPADDAVFVAPGDEIYVDTDAGFLTCAPPPCAVVCRQQEASLTPPAPHLASPAGPQRTRHTAGRRQAACHAVWSGDASQQAGVRAAGEQQVSGGFQRRCLCVPLAACSLAACVTRYTAETGDVVVGRVTEVCSPGASSCLSRDADNNCTQISGKRWKVDVNSRQDAVLLLSAVTLPGNAQAREVGA